MIWKLIKFLIEMRVDFGGKCSELIYFGLEHEGEIDFTIHPMHFLKAYTLRV